MERVYIVTGAGGHLGRNIVALLLQNKQQVRGLLLPGEAVYKPYAGKMQVVRGDVCKPETLAGLFEGLEHKEVVVIHAAAVVDIASSVAPRTWDVNVQGTKNMVGLCLAKGVHRFIHVSSVHAIPELEKGRTIREVSHFSADAVEGGYAKTKAEATQFVLDAVQNQGLPGVVLHPAGIIGPLDPGSNNLVAAIKSYLLGRLPACPKGGYNLVDVRDVASACVAAADSGRIGETYILAAQHYEMKQVFGLLRKMGLSKRKHPCPTVPLWFVKPFASMLEKWAVYRKKAPLITSYSLQALASNDAFSYDKAACELKFTPRDIRDTLRDTALWILAPNPA